MLAALASKGTLKPKASYHDTSQRRLSLSIAYLFGSTEGFAPITN